MPRRLAEVGERPLKRRGRAVPRIAPHLAVGLVGLLIRRPEQGTLVFAGEGLPVEVIGGGEARRTRALAAAVLMHDDAPERCDARRDPDRVADRKDEFSGLGARLVSDAEIRWLGRGEDVVGRRLRDGGRGAEPRADDHDRERGCRRELCNA